MGDLVQRIYALFCGSGRYAVQQPDGSYLAAKRGGEWLPLTPEVVRDHLSGRRTIGVYQIRAQDNTVSWACFDIDGVEGTEVALRALYQTVTRECPREAVLVEKSRRGYHLWVFFDPPVPAPFAYAWGRKLAQETKIPTSTRVRDLHVEIFPKQTRATEDSPGSLVKLPLGIHQLSGKRTEFVDPETLQVVPAESALDSLRPWSPPKELLTSVQVPEQRPQLAAPLFEGDLPCWSRIGEGKIPEGARHLTALAFACHLRDKGLTEDVARIVMLEWWKRLPQPPRTLTEYPWEDAERCLLDAYRKGYYVGCKRIKTEWPELCSPNCPILRRGRIPLGTYQEVEATERVELLGGKYVLECHGPHTVLYDPVTRGMISARGRYPGWNPWAWISFVEEARKAFGREVAEELGRLAEKHRVEWVKREELEMVDDDSVSTPMLFGQHTLSAHYSKSKGYIRISGRTYPLAGELREMGAVWRPQEKCWELPYTPENLRKVKAFLRKNDRVSPKPLPSSFEEAL